MKKSKHLNRIDKKRRTRIIKRKILTSLLILMFLFSFLIEHVPSMPEWNSIFSKLGIGEEEIPFSDAPLKVIFPDVGQGDCAIVIADGETLLIDAGNPESSDNILKILKKSSVSELDYVAVTHPHLDHYGGLTGVLPGIKVSCLLLTDISCIRMDFWGEYRSFLKLAENIPAVYPEPGQSFSLGKGEFTVLGPVKDSPDPNNMSLVIKLEYGDCSFIFTGDAEKEEEMSLVNNGSPVEADVLQVSHHGSHTSSTDVFIRAVNPETAVIQCEAGNAYGHPNRDTLNILGKYGIKVRRTDLEGNIYMGCDGKSIQVAA